MAPKLKKKAKISTSNRMDKQIVYVHTKEYYMAMKKKQLYGNGKKANCYL